MKKTISKLLALTLTAALVLTGCGGGTGEEVNGGENTGSTENGGGESTGDSAAAEGDITDLVIPKLLTRELETFNWLYSQRSEDSENLTQLVDGCWSRPPRAHWLPALRRSGAARIRERPGPSSCVKGSSGSI